MVGEKVKYRKKPLGGVLAACHYKDGPIREMVHNFKYNSVLGAGELLAKFMAKALEENFKFLISNFYSNSNELMFKNLIIKNSLKIKNLELIITFVPLHWQRLAQRGYNQSEILARGVGKKLGLPVLSLLKKVKKTKRQAELSGSKRRQNLEGVFEVNLKCHSGKEGLLVRNLKDSCLRRNDKIDILKGKTIVLIDDVCTTGSTLNECARVLRAAGAKEVWGLVVSRG